MPASRAARSSASTSTSSSAGRRHHLPIHDPARRSRPLGRGSQRVRGHRPLPRLRLLPRRHRRDLTSTTTRLPSSSDFKQPITRQDHTVWDNGNTPKSLGQNGYQQLPSGWIIQWGFAASWGSGDGTITFPIAFPVACRSVQATHLGPDNQFWSARSLTTTSFVIRTSSSANSGYWWLAIGR